MLKMVEYGLLAVSLLTILVLIVISPRGKAEDPLAEEPDAGHVHPPLGAKKS